MFIGLFKVETRDSRFAESCPPGSTWGLLLVCVSGSSEEAEGTALAVRQTWVGIPFPSFTGFQD